ncbi:MAG: hypothetical protein JWO80_4755, partial [Bryobacterales bacterium]|nr:hypothetical protein [Bryobacterales bacterium]
MIRGAALLSLLLGAPASAHMMSMSTGDATVSGNHVEYILRMPLYEVAHTQSPQTALFQHLRFSSGGKAARTLNQECHADAAHDTYLCAAYYEFPETVEHLEIDCTFYAVTVPNHVHLLRAEKNGKPDQAIFDYAFTHAALLFRPPTAFETAVRQIAAGALRSVGGAIQILFLAGLALAARSRRELAALAAMFIVGQIAGALLHWRPPPRFVESAAALTIAYLAVEILFLPEAGLRWLIAGCIGIFHGLYFALFLDESAYRAKWVLTGAALAELAF